jgi:hypothetical protein
VQGGARAHTAVAARARFSATAPRCGGPWMMLAVEATASCRPPLPPPPPCMRFSPARVQLSPRRNTPRQSASVRVNMAAAGGAGADAYAYEPAERGWKVVGGRKRRPRGPLRSREPAVRSLADAVRLGRGEGRPGTLCGLTRPRRAQLRAVRLEDESFALLDAAMQKEAAVQIARRVEASRWLCARVSLRAVDVTHSGRRAAQGDNRGRVARRAARWRDRLARFCARSPRATQ